jgi:hypothetical protein
VRRYRAEGGDGPVLGELSVCVAATLEEAKWIVHDRWPLPGLQGDAMTDLPTPDAFERAAATVDMEAITAVVPMGPDIEPILEQADRFRDAGSRTSWCINSAAIPSRSSDGPPRDCWNTTARDRARGPEFEPARHPTG